MYSSSLPSGSKDVLKDMSEDMSEMIRLVAEPTDTHVNCGVA